MLARFFQSWDRKRITLFYQITIKVYVRNHSRVEHRKTIQASSDGYKEYKNIYGSFKKIEDILYANRILIVANGCLCHHDFGIYEVIEAECR